MRIHKNCVVLIVYINVVNWFQIVFLREDSQVKKKRCLYQTRCELISNCIFTWGFTRFRTKSIGNLKLWIDFKLYFYVRIHKRVELYLLLLLVVNWFQIVFLREDSQESISSILNESCCELISNCIFTWGFTSNCISSPRRPELWIDFKLYFYVRIHKP